MKTAFKRNTFKIAWKENGSPAVKEVNGYVATNVAGRPDFAGEIGIDKREKEGWVASHIPSGISLTEIGYGNRLEACLEAANKLNAYKKQYPSLLEEATRQFQITQGLARADKIADEKRELENAGGNTRTPKEIVEAWRAQKAAEKAAIAEKAATETKKEGAESMEKETRAIVTNEKIDVAQSEDLIKESVDMESTDSAINENASGNANLPTFDGVNVEAVKFGKKLQRAKLIFTGNTKPYKDEIKRLGKAWWNSKETRWEVDVTGYPIEAVMASTDIQGEATSIAVNNACDNDLKLDPSTQATKRTSAATKTSYFAAGGTDADCYYPNQRSDTNCNEMKINRYIYIKEDSLDLSDLVNLDLNALEKIMLDNIEAEKTAYAETVKSTGQWEVAAAETLRIKKAVEYLKTPEIKHTANQWENDGDWSVRSNAVYQFRYRIDKSYRNDHSIHATWYVSVQNPAKSRYRQIAEQRNKLFRSSEEAEKYIKGRIKAYDHLFAGTNPPIPAEYADCFKVGGRLLPGYVIDESGGAKNKAA